MFHSNKVAIIGISGKLPGADTPEELDKILSDKIDCVGNVPKERLELCGADLDGHYAPAAYLKDIDCFDNQFFGISKKEAVYMDPQHRIALETVCSTIESAGYSLGSVRGTNTSVIIGAESDQYDMIFSDENLCASTGMMLSYLSGRISYYLDLRGEAVTLSAACSSSLYAVYDAYNKLISGRCDMAIAGGLNLQCVLFDINDDDSPLASLGIMSEQGHCKAFDNSADGITICEGAGFILMKRLEDAERDNDNILAVIRGIGANQDGGRSSSLTSPSAAAQAELYERVWRETGISPEEIGYYEAHGTGTRIGDPIEIDAITKAFSKFTDKKQICPIGSLKTNFGHPLYASGISGIIKAVLSVRLGKKYPLRSLEKPNSLINFSNSPVYPITELEKWDSEKRIVAINSFGFSGTNVHMLIENYNSKNEKINNSKPYFIKVSTKSTENLNEYKKHISAGITENKNISDISYTLCCGRDDYRFRASTVVENINELKEFLSGNEIYDSSEPPELVILCSGSSFDENETNNLCEEYPVFANEYQKFSACTSSQNAVNASVCVALIKQLEALNIKADYIIGTGIGNSAIDLYKGHSTNDIDALCEKYSSAEFAKEQYISYMTHLSDSENGNIICVDISENGILKTTIENIDTFKCRKMISCVNKGTLLYCLSELYNAGIQIDFNKLFDNKKYRKTYLPTYPFLKTPAWPADIRKNNSQLSNANISSDPEDLKEFIRELWIDALELDSLDDDTDLFDLGLNSLIAVSVLRKINSRTGGDLEFDDLYDYATVDELYEYLNEQYGSSDDCADSSAKIKKITRTDKMAVSGNQKRMLFILENSPNRSLYNMPTCFRIKGNIDVEMLRDCFAEIVKNNEILHTIYSKECGCYYQKVLDDYNFDMKYIDEGKKSEEELSEITASETNAEFDISSGLPIRITLIKYDDEAYHLILNAQHIACDGWTLGLLINDINALYNGKLKNKDYTLPKKQFQYADYASYEIQYLKSDEATQECEYWKNQLNGIKGILDFPIDKKRPDVQTYHGDSVFFELNGEVLDKAEKICRKYRITRSELFESAYAILLYKYSGDSDICIGMPVANRNNEIEEAMYGFFANSIAIRSRFEKGITANDFLLKNSAVINKGIHSATVPFDEIAGLIDFERRPSHSAVYQFFFTYQNFIYNSISFGNATASQYETDSSVVRFDLNLVMKESTDSIIVNAEYDRELFTKEYIEEIIESYMIILKVLLDEEDILVENIALASRSKILKSDDISDCLF